MIVFVRRSRSRIRDGVARVVSRAALVTAAGVLRASLVVAAVGGHRASVARAAVAVPDCAAPSLAIVLFILFYSRTGSLNYSLRMDLHTCTPTGIGFRHSSFFYSGHEFSRSIFWWVVEFKISNAKPNGSFIFKIQRDSGFKSKRGSVENLAQHVSFHLN